MTVVSRVHEGRSACARTGETDGLGDRVFDDRLADLAAAAVEHGEHAFGHVGEFRGVDHGRGDDFRDAGMRCVGDDDDRATGCESGCGVAPGDRVGHGEIAGAEDGDGAERAQHRAEIDLGERLSIRIGAFDAGIDPGAFLDLVGEHPELAGGACCFATEAGFGQGGFKLAALDDVIDDGFDFRGDGAEEFGADFSR